MIIKNSKLKTGGMVVTYALILLLVVGCGVDGDRFHGLKLVDGNGDVYLLKHSFNDVYFVDNLSEIEREKDTLPNVEVNKKLEQKFGN